MIRKITDHHAPIKIKTFLYYVLHIVLFLLLPIAIFTFVTSKSSFIGSIRSMVVLSGSMEPAYPVGSVVYIKKEVGYAIGSAITFKNDADENVTHRITDIRFGEEGTFYQTKGDANTSADSQLVSSDKVIGKVFFSIPYFGKLITFLNTPQGFLLSVIIPSFVFISAELWSIKKEIERETERKVLERLQAQLT